MKMGFEGAQSLLRFLRHPEGKLGLDLGVYGVPETFVVAADGTILYRHVGALTADAIAGPIRNAIEKAVALR